MRAGLAIALLPGLALAQADESWNLHLQSTYVWQHKPGFHSPYEGPNSLRGEAETSYSFTGTAALGLRLGRSTEAYFDPEVAQGKPLSGLLGLAGFSNGELAKTSGSKPKFYRARLFVRHTVELGGESSAVESAAHQLAGRQDARRLVFTAGSLSPLDLFDANAFAHDPRTQFQNWSLMTHAAYDYPADTRGYSTGAAVEYFAPGWSLRAARFEVPRQPNQQQLDDRVLRHYGDQLEASRDYEVAGQQGTVRLLAYRIRAVMATYADALALADATGQPPSLDAVRRNEHVKHGVGVSLEHKLRPDLGLFARAMQADGRSEVYSFTEADRSASAGLSLQGASWQRGEDTVGLGFAMHGLSSGHRALLERGGSSFFLGDGALRYRPEQVVEAYYSASLGHGFSASLDAQRIAHPGYNADRGPASFFGARLHWEM
jgi:hypothetical protein